MACGPRRSFASRVTRGVHAALDTDTRKQLGQVTVVGGGQMEAISAARLDDTTVEVVWRGNGTPWKLSWVKVPPGKAPSVSGTCSVKICEP